jgi:hypothetical protein
MYFMNLSALAVLIPTLILGHSSQISAEEYQSFTSVGFSKNNVSFSGDRYDFESTRLDLNTSYFFDARPTLGPLNQFEYINKISNISAGYEHSKLEDDSSGWSHSPNYSSKNTTNTINVGGEWFNGDFLLGGGYAYTDSEHSSSRGNGQGVDSYKSDNNADSYRLSAGYLFSDDLLVKVNMNKYEDTDGYFTMSVDYNWQLGNVDYVGFTYSTDEYLDFHNVSAKYFMDLANESYLTLGASYIYDNSGGNYENDFWNVNAQYYFNQKTSLSAGYSENDKYNLGVNHFINKNYAVGAFYSSSSDNDYEDDDAFGVNFTAQF